MYAYSLSVVMFTLCMYRTVELCGTTHRQVEMAEGDWDEVTVIRKRAPKAGQLKTPQVSHLLRYCYRALSSIRTQATQSYWLAPTQKCSTVQNPSVYFTQLLLSVPGIKNCDNL